MNRVPFSHRLMVMLAAFFTLAFTAAVASAQSAGELASELSSLSGQMSAAEANASTADQVIAKLDNAEGTFAKVTSSGKVEQGRADTALPSARFDARSDADGLFEEER